MFIFISMYQSYICNVINVKNRSNDKTRYPIGTKYWWDFILQRYTDSFSLEIISLWLSDNEKIYWRSKSELKLTVKIFKTQKIIIVISIWHLIYILYVDDLHEMIAKHILELMFNPIWISNLLDRQHRSYFFQDTLLKLHDAEKHYAIVWQCEDILLLFYIYAKVVELILHLESRFPNRVHSVPPICDY
jgi:hypothetical protein